MSQELVDCYLDAEDYPRDECWRLVEWCRQHGATEFGVTAVPDFSSGCLQEEAVFGTALKLRRRLHPHNRGVGDRETFAHTIDEFLHFAEKQLAMLTEETVEVLKLEYRGGLFGKFGQRGDDEFIEDPILYREGRLMLGVSTHEGRGVLRVTQHERFMLEASKFVLRPDWWT